MGSQELPYAFIDARGWPYRLDNRRIRRAIANGVLEEYRADSDGRVRKFRFSQKYWDEKRGLRETLDRHIVVSANECLPLFEPGGEESPHNPAHEDDLFADGIDEEAAKEVVCTQAVKRLGQADFRQSVGAAYSWRCAVTNCDVVHVLEAAHVVPYQVADEEGYDVRNGILLRSDIHQLFDAGLTQFHYDDRRLVASVSSEIGSTEYAGFDGKDMHLPAEKTSHPSPRALQIRQRIQRDQARH